MRVPCPHRRAPGTPALARWTSAVLALVLLGCGGSDEQRTGTTPPAPPVPPALRAHSATTSAQDRAGILAAAQRAITRDARARARCGEFKGPVKRTACDKRGGPSEGHADVVVYSCIAIAFVGPRTSTAPPLMSGQPFQLRIDYPRRRFAWCRIVPPGGEGTGRPGREVEPPAACGGIG